MDKKEIGNRLRIFIKEKFGTYEKGAHALGMKPPSLQTYLNGNSIPGGIIISKLKDLGCDTDWLLLNKEMPDRVSDGTAEYTIKDRVITQQAEEIYKLKIEIEEATRNINELIDESEALKRKINKIK